MNEVRGGYVFAVADCSGPWARGTGRKFVRAGTELLVTSASRSGEWVNVKEAKHDPVFRLRAEQVTRQGRRLGEMPEGGIAKEDPRIAWIFEDAARFADRMGYCRVFDEITGALSLPGRFRLWSLSYEVAPGVKLQAKIDARSRVQAEAILRERLSGARMPLAIDAAS